MGWLGRAACFPRAVRRRSGVILVIVEKARDLLSQLVEPLRFDLSRGAVEKPALNVGRQVVPLLEDRGAEALQNAHFRFSKTARQAGA